MYMYDPSELIHSKHKLDVEYNGKYFNRSNHLHVPSTGRGQYSQIEMGYSYMEGHCTHDNHWGVTLVLLLA